MAGRKKSRSRRRPTNSNRAHNENHIKITIGSIAPKARAPQSRKSTRGGPQAAAYKPPPIVVHNVFQTPSLATNQDMFMQHYIADAAKEASTIRASHDHLTSHIDSRLKDLRDELTKLRFPHPIRVPVRFPFLESSQSIDSQHTTNGDEYQPSIDNSSFGDFSDDESSFSTKDNSDANSKRGSVVSKDEGRDHHPWTVI